MKNVLLGLVAFAITSVSNVWACSMTQAQCDCKFTTASTWTGSGHLNHSINLGCVNRGVPSAEAKCATLCKQQASGLHLNQARADYACSQGVANGTWINAISKAGAIATSGIDGTIGRLQNAAAVYSCPQGGSVSGANCVFPAVALIKTCPAGWLAPTNVNGGVTADGKCKKAVAGCSLPAPLPANGSQIGTSGYGFTWENSVVVFGNAGNGGAALNSCPNGYTISGINCIKASYAATVVSPKICKLNAN